MYINLNVHSYYSLQKSTLSIDDIIKYASDHKQQYVCLTDEKNLYGAIEFYNKAIKANLKPIIGLEINYQDNVLVLIAKNHKGFQNLLKISTHIMKQEKFVIQDLMNDIFTIRKSGTIIFEKNFFTTELGEKNTIAMPSVRYYVPSDYKYYRALQAIKNDKKLSFETNNKTADTTEYFMTADEISKKYNENDITNVNNIINSCEWKMPEFKNDILHFPTPKNLASRPYLESLCKAGVKYRFTGKTNIYDNDSNSLDLEYAERLKFELNTINNMGYNDYFLIVHEFIDYGKKQGIMFGPGRGSAAGSLVAYLLGITDIDPIRYNLFFERFLNPERTSLPDIDTDILDTRRDEIINHLFEKYGNDHVAHIITFQRMKAKMALRDVARILDIKLPIIDRIAKSIKSEYDKDIMEAIKQSKSLQNDYKSYPDLFDIAQKLINSPRQVGTHAAGIVLSQDNLINVVPLQNGLNGWSMTQFSMEYLEPLGLIKMDLLGLRNLSTIDNVIKMVKKTRNEIIDIYNIDLEEKAIFNNLTAGQTAGIFQLESPGMKNLIMRMKPKNIEDISITSSLFRPGPQQNIPTFLARRNGEEKISYVHPDLKPILQSTNGIIVYQEQVLQIVQTVANFSLAKADIFRRAISKKNEAMMASLKDEFINGATKNKYSLDVAQQIYKYIYEFANYGFNHSHSIAYSYISYWMAYLKSHYPIEFITTLLSTDNSRVKLLMYMSEAKKFNVAIIGPSINDSYGGFSIKKGKIVFGFAAIKGIGNEAIKKLLLIRNSIENKKFKDYLEAIAYLYRGGVTKAYLEKLIKVGSFDCFNEKREFLLHNLDEIISKGGIMDISGSPIFDMKLDNHYEKEDEQYWYDQEIQLMGVSFQSNNFEKYIVQVKNDFKIRALIDINGETEGKVLVLIKQIKKMKTKQDKDMAIINVEDISGIHKLMVFYKSFDNIINNLKENKYYILSVKLGWDKKSFVINKIDREI